MRVRPLTVRADLILSRLEQSGTESEQPDLSTSTVGDYLFYFIQQTRVS